MFSSFCEFDVSLIHVCSLHIDIHIYSLASRWIWLLFKYCQYQTVWGSFCDDQAPKNCRQGPVSLTSISCRKWQKLYRQQMWYSKVNHLFSHFMQYDKYSILDYFLSFSVNHFYIKSYTICFCPIADGSKTLR